MDKANTVVLGQGTRIKGKVRGAEDLVLSGQIDGTVSLQQNQLTIEESGQMVGDVQVENITVRGEHAGNTSASGKIQFDGTARVLGDVKAPRIAVADGAKFKGNVDMQVDLPKELNLRFKK